MAGKWLQLIREAIPGLQRVAVLWDVNTGPYQTRPLEAAAKAVSIELQILEFRASSEIEGALSGGLKKRPQAVIQLGSPQINQGAARIADFLAKNRLPGISPFRAFSDSGGLMSYGPNLPILYRRMAPYISGILKGTKPINLPVEQPTHYELIINLKTAKALGLKIQQSMLLRADEVIQ